MAAFLAISSSEGASSTGGGIHGSCQHLVLSSASLAPFCHKIAIVYCQRLKRIMGEKEPYTLPETIELLKNNPVQYNNAPSSGLQPSPM